jgi:hypothetical protein
MPIIDLEKNRVARARRLADTFGLRLAKSRTRNPDAPDYGCYALIDIDTGGAAYGTGSLGFDADLSDIEAYLAS